MGSTLIDGLIYSVIGFSIVFVVLAVLIVLAVLMRYCIPAARTKKPAPAPKAAPAPQPAAVAPQQADEDELAAVIAAALAMLDAQPADGAQQPAVAVRLPAGHKNAWRARARMDNLH